MKKMCCALVGVGALLLASTSPALAGPHSSDARNDCDNAFSYASQAYQADDDAGHHNENGYTCYIILYYCDYFAHLADTAPDDCTSGLYSQYCYLFTYRALSYCLEALLFDFQLGNYTSPFLHSYYYCVLCFYHSYQNYVAGSCQPEPGPEPGPGPGHGPGPKPGPKSDH